MAIVSAATTQQYRMIDGPSPNITLVLGLIWHPLVGSDYSVLAKKKAIDEKADVYAHSPGSVSVGTLKYNKKLGKPISAKNSSKGSAETHRTHSAALAMTAAFPNGFVVTKVIFEDHSVWVVGIRDGTVMARTDIVYPSMDDANYAIEQLQKRYPNQSFTVYSTDIDDDPDANPFDLEQLYQGISNNTELQSISFSIASVPTPIKLIFVLAIGTLCVQFGLGQYHKWVNSRAEQAAAALRLDPDQAWANVIETVSAQTRIETTESWHQLLETTVNTPPVIGFWVINEVNCKPAGNEKGWRWDCTGKYIRPDDGNKILSNNDTFLANIPAGWKVEWEPLALDARTAKWSVAAASTHMNIKQLPAMANLGPKWITSLQKVQAAFKTFTLTGSGNITIPAPTNPDGSPVGDPSTSTPVIVTKQLTLNGPLRSLTIFDIDAVPTRILDLKVTFADPGKGDATKTSINESYMQAEVKVETVSNSSLKPK